MLILRRWYVSSCGKCWFKRYSGDTIRIHHEYLDINVEVHMLVRIPSRPITRTLFGRGGISEETILGSSSEYNSTQSVAELRHTPDERDTVRSYGQRSTKGSIG